MDIGELEKVSADIGEGVWEDVPTMPGVRVHVLPSTTPAAFRASRRFGRSAGRKLRDNDGRLLPETDDAIEKRVLADVILIGWEGITADGEPVPYSKENAARLIDIEVFREAVTQAADKAAYESTKRLLDLEKN